MEELDVCVWLQGYDLTGSMEGWCDGLCDWSAIMRPKAFLGRTGWKGKDMDLPSM